MTDKELRKLRRDDLLQILIRQQRQIDELTEAVKRAEAELEKRDIAIQEAGSVAEAAIRLNGVFEAAQAAADQYGAEMRSRADALEETARKQAEDAKDMAIQKKDMEIAELIARQSNWENEKKLAISEAEKMRIEAKGPVWYWPQTQLLS